MQWLPFLIEKNTIYCLKDAAGNMVFDHKGKVALLYHAFKHRMGVTLQPRMLFDLSSLIPVRVNLDSLVAHILKEKTDRVIKFMPTDKAPGPDGFNGLFMKKC
jgi:hypothetical protein